MFPRATILNKIEKLMDNNKLFGGFYHQKVY